MERLAARIARENPELSVVVLRPAPIVGPGVDTPLTRHFEAPRLLHVRGTRPRWQFCHVDDLASAIEFVAAGRLDASPSGEPVVAAVGSEGWLEAEDIERLTGRRRLELPSSVARVATDRMQRLGITPEGASQLAYLVYPWVVEPRRLFDAGWRPQFTNADALAAQVAEGGTRGPRFDRKDAAGAAVGATLAVVATAAMVRRARKRRRM
jgi:nucleoside-diphosphate-sugar epimerase